MEEKKVPIIRANKFKTKEMTESETREAIKSVIHSVLSVLIDDSAVVTFTQSERTTVYEISIRESEFGQLLGKQGKTINALRTLVLAMASKHGIRAAIDTINDKK